jgi:deoxyribose-phosphate aldolase
VPKSLHRAEVAQYIQHTLIEVGVSRDRIRTHAEDCVRYGFDAAMVPGSWVGETADVLRGTNVGVASAIDFPIVGSMTSAGKMREADELVRLGVTQIDMGVQIGWLRSGMYNKFRDDIAGVVSGTGIPVKVMLELALLTAKEREIAVELALDAGASYLKNASSGAIETASPESIRWLVGQANGRALVKASGAIKTYEQVVELIEAGASLVGSSAGVAIVDGTDYEPGWGY